MITLNTAQFTWHNKSKTFVGEMSELGKVNPYKNFLLESERTGAKVEMKGVDVIDDLEERVGWIFAPVSNEHKFSLTVWND